MIINKLSAIIEDLQKNWSDELKEANNFFEIKTNETYLFIKVDEQAKTLYITDEKARDVPEFEIKATLKHEPVCKIIIEHIRYYDVEIDGEPA